MERWAVIKSTITQLLSYIKKTIKTQALSETLCLDQRDYTIELGAMQMSKPIFTPKAIITDPYLIRQVSVFFGRYPYI